MNLWNRLGLFWQIVLLIMPCQLVEFGLYKLGIIDRYRPLVQVKLSVSGSLQSANQVGDNVNDSAQ